MKLLLKTPRQLSLVTMVEREFSWCKKNPCQKKKMGKDKTRATEMEKMWRKKPCSIQQAMLGETPTLTHFSRRWEREAYTKARSPHDQDPPAHTTGKIRHGRRSALLPSFPLLYSNPRDGGRKMLSLPFYRHYLGAPLSRQKGPHFFVCIGFVWSRFK